MDLAGRLLRFAASRPHVLVATMSGGTGVRLTAERELRLRGWPAAVAPAQADVLFVAGELVPGLAGALGDAERAMAAPRARANALRPEEVAPALDAARRRLSNLDGQREDALTRMGERPHGGRGMSGMDDMGHDMGGMRDMGHDMSGMDDTGPDMGGMNDMGGMAMPAGLPMAERGEDRDGLRLDQLHVPLGPILADWPAGLVLRVTLQGDVIAQARVETVLGPAGGSWWTEPWRRATVGELVTEGEAARRRSAAHLDSLGRFLAVAGWADAAMTARRLRDDLLAGAAVDVARRRVVGFARRVTRSWTLRWLTRGLGRLDAADAVALGVSGPALRAAGDVTARYRQWIAEIVDDVGRLDDLAPVDPSDGEGPRGRLDGRHPPSAALVDALPPLLVGTELAAARLIVASLDPDVDELAPYPQVVANG